MDDFDECVEAMGGKQNCCICTSVTCGVTLLILTTAFVYSTVEPTEYGLLYDSLFKDIDPDYIYEGGYYYVGFYKSLIIFPANYKTIEFSDVETAQAKPLETRTKEGLSLNLHFSFQYKLQKENIPKLYRLVGENYEVLFDKIARHVILREGGEYMAPQYWKNRTYIGNEMMGSLDKALQKAYANCVGF